MKPFAKQPVLILSCWAMCFGTSALYGADNMSRAELFQQAWSLVKKDFFDPQYNGVDWQQMRDQYKERAATASSRQEFSDRINQMLGTLHTSHTHYFTPDDPRYYQLLGVFDGSGAFAKPLARIRKTCAPPAIGYVGIGIDTIRSADGTFVSAVFDGGPADQAGILVGDRVVSVGNEPFHAIRSFRNRAGQSTPMTIQRRRQADPMVVSVTPRFLRGADMFADAMRASARLLNEGSHAIAYVHIWSYSGVRYQELLDELLFDGKLRDADALLLDIRDGWGGASAAFLNIFNRHIPQLEMRWRDGTVVSLDRQWRKPVALLINGGVRSGKEVFAYGFKNNNIGPVVGTTTAGAVVAGSLRFLADDSVLYLAVADIRVDGNRLEGQGITPTHEVTRDIPFSAGKDPQRDVGLQLLLQKLRSAFKKGKPSSADLPRTP